MRSMYPLSLNGLAFSCEYLIDENYFIDNVANVQGGAINYDKNRPIMISTNIFFNNKAPYGSEIASYAYNVIVLNHSATITASG